MGVEVDCLFVGINTFKVSYLENMVYIAQDVSPS